MLLGRFLVDGSFYSVFGVCSSTVLRSVLVWRVLRCSIIAIYIGASVTTLFRNPIRTRKHYAFCVSNKDSTISSSMAKIISPIPVMSTRVDEVDPFFVVRDDGSLVLFYTSVAIPLDGIIRGRL